MITSSMSTIEIPGSMDVLCGRGRGYFEHSGNRRMLSIIARFKSEYQTASKVEKSTIAQRVLEIVLSPQDGVKPRFLKRAPSNSSGRKSTNADNGAWYELCEKEVYKKVAHTLREQKSIIKLSKEASKLRESIMHQRDTPIIKSDDEDEWPEENYHQTSMTSEQPPNTPPFVRLVSRDSFAMSEPSRSGLVDLDVDPFDDLFVNRRAEESTNTSHRYCRKHMLLRGEQQPLNFLQEPVFNEKEVDTLLHAVLGEDAADDFMLDSFLEDLILHNSFRASFSTPTAVV